MQTNALNRANADINHKRNEEKAKLLKSHQPRTYGWI